MNSDQVSVPTSKEGQNRRHFGIGLKGFANNDAVVVQSILSVCKYWTKYEWSITSLEDCDMVLTSLPRQSEALITVTFQKRLDDLQIKETLEYPARVRALLDILTKVEGFLALETDTPLSVSRDIYKSNKNGAKSLPELIYDRLHQSSRPSVWMVVSDGDPWFKVNEDTQEVFFCAVDGASRVQADGDYKIISGFDESKYNFGDAVFSLDQWLWQISLSLSPLGLFPWLNARALSVHLTAWPDFGRFPHHTDHVRLAALLTSGWYTLQDLTAASEAKTGHVASLLNALSLMGSLKWKEDNKASGRLFERTALPKIFGRLRSRFNL